MTLGSTGGTGNDGAPVVGVYSDGFESDGDYSPALIQQSIGAGGGVQMVSGDDSPNITLGGSAGANGDGGDVTVVNSGNFLTLGTRSHALVMQSIGGGGGAVLGDFNNPLLTLNTDNSGDGGDIVFVQSGNMNTVGDGAFGIIAQTLGGGGGFVDGFFAGNAGGTGTPGSITSVIGGTVQTEGAGASAILMQSIGGGIGGDITYVQSGSVITMGDNSLGIIAQSLGGNGGWVDGDYKAATGTGTAGDLLFNISGSVVTLGDGAHGALLQSIGGGDAGDIDYAQSGDVITAGDGSMGLIAQSLGGGGGWFDGNFTTAGGSGDGGALRFSLTGSIDTSGAGSNGALLQTIGDNSGDIAYSQGGNIVTRGDEFERPHRPNHQRHRRPGRWRVQRPGGRGHRG